MVSELLSALEKKPKPLIWLYVIALIILLSVIDYFTGHEISFAVFYLLPVSMAAYALGLRWGLVISLACAVIWQMVNTLAGQVFSHGWIGYWNMGTRYAFFGLVVALLCSLKTTIEKERGLSRKDFLTGALNNLAFYEFIQMEIARLGRYKRPFTIAVLDLDHFKELNDTLGHEAGDSALKEIVSAIQSSLRETDVVARLGGDEFVVFIAECASEKAQLAITRIHEAIVKAMQARLWKITPSIGVITCHKPPTMQEMLALADQAMYRAKKNGGNQAVYAQYGAE